VLPIDLIWGSARFPALEITTGVEKIAELTLPPEYGTWPLMNSSMSPPRLP